VVRPFDAIPPCSASAPEPVVAAEGPWIGVYYAPERVNIWDWASAEQLGEDEVVAVVEFAGVHSVIFCSPTPKFGARDTGYTC
jgi:hypothetical protein